MHKLFWPEWSTLISVACMAQQHCTLSWPQPATPVTPVLDQYMFQATDK